MRFLTPTYICSLFGSSFQHQIVLDSVSIDGEPINPYAGCDMLTHIVFFRFPSSDIANQAKAKLLSMAGKIPALKSIEVGIDIVRSQRSWDLALLTRFADKSGLEEYSVNPIHQEVLLFLREHAIEVAAVDYISD